MQVRHFKRYSTNYPEYSPNKHCNKDLSFGVLHDYRRDLTKEQLNQLNITDDEYELTKNAARRSFRNDDTNRHKETDKVLKKLGIKTRPFDVTSKKGDLVTMNSVIMNKAENMVLEKYLPIMRKLLLALSIIFGVTIITNTGSKIIQVKTEKRNGEDQEIVSSEHIKSNILGRNVKPIIEDGIIDHTTGKILPSKTKDNTTTQQTEAHSNEIKTKLTGTGKPNDLVSAMFAENFKLDKRILVLSFPKDFKIVTEPLKQSYVAAEDNLISEVIKYKNNSFAILIKDFRIAKMLPNGKVMKTSARSGLTITEDINKIANLNDEIRNSLIAIARNATPKEEEFIKVFGLNTCICTDENSPTTNGATLKKGDRVLQKVRKTADFEKVLARLKGTNVR